VTEWKFDPLYANGISHTSALAAADIPTHKPAASTIDAIFLFIVIILSLIKMFFICIQIFNSIFSDPASRFPIPKTNSKPRYGT
jgi:hypothetical protein